MAYLIWPDTKGRGTFVKGAIINLKWRAKVLYKKRIHLHLATLFHRMTESFEIKDMADFKKDLVNVDVQSRHNSDASEDSLLRPTESYGSVGFKDYDVLQVDLEDLPQGRHLGLFSTVILFVSRIFGSGIWATPASVFAGVGGNPFLFFLLWIIAALMAFAGLYTYLELGSIVPRSGGTKVFLEFIYRRPKRLMSVVISLNSLLFGISLTNALIFGKYVLCSIGYEAEFIEETRWSNAIGGILIVAVTVVHGISVRHGVLVQNFLGALKLLLIAIMSLTGLYVVLFPSRITGLENQFHLDKFFQFEDEKLVSGSSVTSALLGCFFTFGGWNSVHTVSSEIIDPVRTFKIAGPVSLLLALFNFILINIAYLKVIPHDQLINAGPLVGSILFEKVLGYRLGRQFVTISIALSAASNVFVVVYSMSRMNQEIFREGYLPFSSTMASNFHHTKTPLYSLLVCSFLTLFWLVVLPPSGNSFNYVVSMEGYPNTIFTILVSVGIFIIRRRYPDQRAPIRASLTGAVFIVLVSIVVLVSPFLTSNNDNSSTDIPYLPPYHILALSLLGGYGLFWALKFEILPRVFGYTLKKEIDTHSDGLTVKRWVKRYN